MEDLLNERKGQIQKIAHILSNINHIARDINVETMAQGEKLLGIDKDMGQTVGNTSGALKELREAEVK